MVKKNNKKKVPSTIFKGESNPFNIKINREKHCILGKNPTGTKGLRGISRGESYNKRKTLWQKTKVIAGKANKFTDKRWMDGSEESDIKRLVQERKKKLKKNLFNLNETEETLTHGGMPLDLAKPIRGGGESDSDNDEPLGAAFVNKAHFGGPSDSKSDAPKNHKDILAGLIVESKKQKYEKKIEKEQTEDLTEELDKSWRTLISSVGRIGSVNAKPVPISKPDEYMILANQLKFEKRGTPTARVKTAEELELEEKEILKKLEAERIARMNDDVPQRSKKAVEHVSADSILDDFDFLEPVPVQENSGEKEATQEDSDYSDDDDESDGNQESEEEEGNMEIEDDIKEPEIDDHSITLDKNLPVIPSKLADFEEFVTTSNFSPERICQAVDGILKPYLKAKSENILKKLAAFFGILLEYALKHLDTDPTISGLILPQLHTIAGISPVHNAEVFLKYLDQEQQSYQESKKLKKKKGFMSLQSLLILKYCSVLYSVSDFRHPIVTPAVIFMCDILSSTYPVTLSNIASRLFVCNILAHCVCQSKRFVPDAICFLNTMLRLALPSENKNVSQDSKTKQINLVLNSKPTSDKILDLDYFNINKTTVNDSIKSSIIFKSVSLLNKFATLYTQLPSYSEIFSETVSLCSLLPTDSYPDSVKDSISNLTTEIKSNSPKLKQLVYQNTKPKPLKLFDPLFESKFDKRDNINKKFKELKQVSQKIRREEKCIIRDMRRDAQMIAAEKLKETLASDAERKRKVKELYHDLATQEGEYKKMMKKKS
ncbi:hypothetical protein JTE90_027643 [Oedothorax gibbosus]|uniref:Nucleolar protein 14 n=1 Tax=Oedothorax gibbosus TaxID=931172 RepID=A0AAV6USW3_9ARAC|nr:hypothetical protein JTE90_027643 [Oedothorax gibbosus]